MDGRVWGGTRMEEEWGAPASLDRERWAIRTNRRAGALVTRWNFQQAKNQES